MNKNRFREYNNRKSIKRRSLMQNEYVREQEVNVKTEIEKEAELIRTIIKTREELKIANRNFEYARRGFDRLLYLSN